MGDKKKKIDNESLQKQNSKEAKKKKKQLLEQKQRQKKLQQDRAIADQKVKLIYDSGLADAYKYFITQAFKEDVKFNIFQYAAQKMLKYQKIKRQKSKKIADIHQKLGKSLSKQKIQQINAKQTIDSSNYKKQQIKIKSKSKKAKFE